MGRRVGCVVLVVGGLFGAGLFVTWVADGRVEQSRVYCQNNLRQLGQFAGLGPDDAAKRADPGPPRDAVPPGTVVNPALPPDRRLSWAADALLVFNQKRQDTAALAAGIDRTLAWDADGHRDIARTPVATLLCYGNPAAAPPGDPAVTQYVGLSGVDPDAAALGLGPPVPPRAGGFRYDGPTPLAAIADGTSQTALFAETNADLGPWLRGGPSTVRGLDVGERERPPIGVGGQFGGNHPGGGNVGLADTSVRFLTDRIDPVVMRKLVTIAGEEADVPAGEL